jgi:hypothetical protein
VIQVHESKIAMSEEKVADWKILVNQWRNEHSLRDELAITWCSPKLTKSLPPLHRWEIPPAHLNLSSGHRLPLAMMPKSLQYKPRIWAIMR